MAKILFSIFNFQTKKFIFVVVLLFSVFSYLFSVASADAADGIRNTINFQGKLVDSTGLNVADGNYTVVFTLYDAASGGTNLWDETQTVSTIDGIFQVELGTIDTTLGNVNFNSDTIYLGIKVGTDLEMTPRIRFSAVPYAFNAAKVNGLSVTNTSGNPFSSATTLQIGEGKTVVISNGLTFAGTDSTTITFQGTDTYVGRGTTDTLTNKTIGNTGLTFSGAATDITSATNEDLTFTPNGSGDLVLTSDFNSGISIGSSSNTTAPLSISGGIGSNASFIVNNTNSGDLFVASQAGATKFVIRNDGTLGLNSANYASCAVLNTNADGSVSCASAGGSDMQSGATYGGNSDTTSLTIPLGITMSVATVSAAPTSSVADVYVRGIANLYSGNATDQTVTLSLRKNTCSGEVLSTTTTSVTVAANAFSQVIELAGVDTNPGTGSKDYILCESTTGAASQVRNRQVFAQVIDPIGPEGPAGSGGDNFWQLPGEGVLAPGNLTTDLLVGGVTSASAKFAVLNINSGPPTASLSAGIAGGSYMTATGLIQTTANQTLTLGGMTTGNVLINPQGINFVGIGTSNPRAPLDVRTALNTGPTASISANSTFAAMVVNNSGTGDIFTASSSGLNRFVVKQNGSVGIGTTTPESLLEVQGAEGNDALITLDADDGDDVTDTWSIESEAADNDLSFVNGSTELMRLTSGGTLYLAAAGFSNCGMLTTVSNAVTCSSPTGGGTNYFDQRNGLTYLGNTTSDFAVGGLSSSSAKFRVSVGNTQPTASVSGNTTAAAFVVDNLGTGDLFSASKSGETKFSILATGDVRINNLLSCNVETDATGLLTCGVDDTGPGGSGTNYLKLTNGTFSFINSTADVLLGGDATGSAKFAFMNLNSNSGLDPVASFSGTLRIGAKNNSTVAQQTTWTKVSQTTPGTISNGGTANIASISASAVYNGSVYVGTYKDNSAEIYRYNGTGSSWTRVSFGAGQIDNGGTTNIASVSAMTIYDGRLYVGTSKMNEAEIYRYEGGTDWTRVSGTVTGTVCTAATQDGVSVLGVHNGKLYAGTREGAPSNAAGTGARFCRYEGGVSWTNLTATAGQFVATTTAGVHAVTAMATYNNTLFLGLSKAGDADVVRYSGGVTFLAMNTANATGGFNINGTATAAYAADEITSMLVYNNQLMVGVRKNNAADLLALVYSPVATAADQPWVRVIQGAGQIAGGGTSNIDQIASMTIYNGMLLVGTREGNSAEVYRYTGGDQKFFKVSQAAAGTIASGDTSGIDGVVNMIPSNGDLYIGTMELGRAEVYKHTASIDRSYGLEFHANPQIAGGEQSSVDNHASIFYLASASANLGSSNAYTGAFIFSHGIQTRNGFYDVAEDYATRDDSLKAGDVVSIDPNEHGFVKKSEKAYDRTVIGVFSENPALRLSQADVHIDGARAIPVALAGRVSVKVTTENGEIKPGDYLTASSKPGFAMKATLAGSVLGQAMESFSCEGTINCTGRVLAYIKSTSYEGDIASTFTSLTNPAQQSGRTLLEALATQTQPEVASSIVTDKLVAGLSIVSPEITTNTLQVNTIEAATGSDIGIRLSDEGILAITNASGAAGMVFTGSGDAYFAGSVNASGLNVTGTLVAEKLQVEEIEIPAEAWEKAFENGGLETIEARIKNQESRIANLESLFASASAVASATGTPTPIASDSAVSLLATMPAIEDFEKPNTELFNVANLARDGLATYSGKLAADKLQVAGSAIIEGILHVVDFITTKNLIVDQLATFLGKAVFKGDVLFEGRPIFSSDTAGFAVIKKGSDRVEVKFAKAYDTVPLVSANLTVSEVSPIPHEDIESLIKRQDALEREVLGSNARYVVTKRTVKGFTILLAKPATEDMTFSWMAVGVDKPVVQSSNGDNSEAYQTQDDENSRPISSTYPSSMPTSSILKPTEAILPFPPEIGERPAIGEARKEVSEDDSD